MMVIYKKNDNDNISSNKIEIENKKQYDSNSTLDMASENDGPKQNKNETLQNEKNSKNTTSGRNM